MTLKNKIYISGKITGINPDTVKAKFNNAEKLLKKQGYTEIINPIYNGIPYNAPYEVHMAMDIILLMGCEVVYLLSDWQHSKGATIEKALAEISGKTLIYQEEPKFNNLKDIIYDVTGISFYDIAGDTRLRKYVYARMLFAHYCREQGASLLKIAGELKRCHATIIYYLNRFEDEKKFNVEFRELAKQIETNMQCQ